MATLIKRKGLFPSRAKKTVNQFFYDFITSDFSDGTDRNFATLDSKPPSLNLKETDSYIKVESAVPKIKKEDFKFDIDRDIIMITPEKDEVKKIEIFTRKEFNYRSFCRLPKL